MLVSAVIADGPPRRMLESIADGRAELVLPELVEAELKRVLAEKLGVEGPAIEAILGLLEELVADPVKAPDTVEAVTGDPTDDRILAAAAAGGAQILISGDCKHLLPVGRYRGMRIIRPQDFLAEIAQ